MAKIVDSLKNLSVENGKNSRLVENKGTFLNKSEFVVSIEEKVSSDNYILNVCGSQSGPDIRVGVSLSDCSCVVYSIGDSVNKIGVLDHNESSIVGIKFSATSRNIIYTANSSGIIAACDLRAKGKVVAEFKDNNEDGKLKPLASFDINCDERLLAGGTEHIGGDSFILFWDVRLTSSKSSPNEKTNSLLGGYWESHMDDITSLAFNFNKRDELASGSTDGLINIFDLKQNSEEAALTYSLNTESSVDRIGWLSNDNLWCTTHTHCLQLWNCEDATPYANYQREDLNMSPSMNENNSENCYLVRIHVPNTFGNPFLLSGMSVNKGELLSTLSLGKGQLEPYYSITGNKQIVRDSWLHEKSGCLVTGGESGILNVFKQSEPVLIQRNSNCKSNKRTTKIVTEKKSDKNRTKPY